ncbi:hypothetical protein L0F63_001188 [Massospora cicadina]|nr:hypothetical protein L0F63_001188 [Massospora cicadina]
MDLEVFSLGTRAFSTGSSGAAWVGGLSLPLGLVLCLLLPSSPSLPVPWPAPALRAEAALDFYVAHYVSFCREDL